MGERGRKKGGRWLDVLQPRLTLKKGTRNYYFQLNEAPSKSITPLIAFEVPLEIEIGTIWPWDWRGELVAVGLLLTLKKGIRTFNF